MRFSSSDIKEISTLVKYHDLEISSDEKLLKKWIAKLGEPTMRSLIDIEIADAYAQNPELATERLERVKEVKERIDDVVKSMSAFSKKDLVIGGRELLEIGLQGREIGETLDKMFEMITDGKLQNTKESLTDFLKEIKQERETDIVL